MSSNPLENNIPPSRQAANRLLLRLKTQGPQTAAALGADAGTTGEAARQQLVRLAEEGLVEATEAAHGVGRPAQTWALTGLGHARFPDSHAEVTVQLLQAIQSTLGAKTLDRLIAARSADMRKRYQAEVSGAENLEARVANLARIRTREGYMAEWWKEEKAFVLAENHCPIRAAAQTCPGFCRSELDLFRKVLGAKATVTRTEHLLSGSRRCAYRIEPA